MADLSNDNSAILATQLPMEEKMLLLALRWRQRPDGWCVASDQQLAWLMSTTPPVVASLLTSLLAKGLLTSATNPDEAGLRGFRIDPQRLRQFQRTN